MTVETVVACLIGVVLVVAIVLLLRRMRATRSVHAAEAIQVARPPEQIDAEVQAALAGIAGARLSTLEVGHLVVSIRRSPPWTILPALLAFPVGLVALLYREDVPLDVRLFRSESGGSTIALSGRTEAQVLTRVREALVPVAGHVQTGATFLQ